MHGEVVVLSDHLLQPDLRTLEQVSSVSYYINLHAIYIAAAGVGLICALAINVSLQRRIEALESAVKRMSGH